MNGHAGQHDHAPSLKSGKSCYGIKVRVTARRQQCHSSIQDRMWSVMRMFSGAVTLDENF